MQHFNVTERLSHTQTPVRGTQNH